MNNTVTINEKIEELYAMQLLRTDPADNHDLENMRSLLRGAFASALTEKQQTCITRYYFDRKTIVQIAEELHVAPSTVSRHIHAAKRNLKKLNGLV